MSVSRRCDGIETHPPCQRALSALRRAAEGTDNVLFPMKAALAALATTGEVSAALRDVWGRYWPRGRLLTAIASRHCCLSRRPSAPGSAG